MASTTTGRPRRCKISANASCSGLGHASAFRARDRPASARWRTPPTTSSAFATSRAPPAKVPQRRPRRCRRWTASGVPVVSLSSIVSSGLDMRVLILGGTSEARELSHAPRAPTGASSRRCRSPGARAHPSRRRARSASAASAAWTASRTGSETRAIDAVVDATHPFAVTISANAVAACARRRPPARLDRAPALDAARPATAGPRLPMPWPPRQALGAGAAPRLSDRRPPRAAGVRRRSAARLPRPHHRSAGRRTAPTASHAASPSAPRSTSRPRRCLMRRRGASTCSCPRTRAAPRPIAKIEAARRLGLPVVMIARPAKPAGDAARRCGARPTTGSKGSPLVMARSARCAAYRSRACARCVRITRVWLEPTITSVRMSACARDRPPRASSP